MLPQFPRKSRDRKRKSLLLVKQQSKKSHQTSTENILRSQRSYFRYDSGPNATEVSIDIPPHHLQDLVVSFYKTKVIVTEQRAKQLELLTMQHGCDETVYSIYGEQRHLLQLLMDLYKIHNIHHHRGWWSLKIHIAVEINRQCKEKTNLPVLFWWHIIPEEIRYIFLSYTTFNVLYRQEMVRLCCTNKSRLTI